MIKIRYVLNVNDTEGKLKEEIWQLFENWPYKGNGICISWDPSWEDENTDPYPVLRTLYEEHIKDGSELLIIVSW